MTKNKKKIKKHMSIKIFNFVKRDIYTIVFAKFVNKIIFLFNQTIIKIDTH